MALEPVDKSAPDVPLLGESDKRAMLSSYFDAGPSVLIFLRHFG
jgi:hypothetical protein